MAIYAKVVAPETIVLFEGSPLKIMSVEELYDALDLMLSEIRTVDGVDGLRGCQVRPHFKTKEIQIQKKDTIFLHLFELHRRNLFPDSITVPIECNQLKMGTHYWRSMVFNSSTQTIELEWFNYDEIPCSMCSSYVDKEDHRLYDADERYVNEFLRRLDGGFSGAFVCSNCVKHKETNYPRRLRFCTSTALHNACVIEKTWEILFRIKSIISSKNRALKTVQRRMAKLMF